MDDFLEIGKKKYKSRLLIGSGKFSAPELIADTVKSAESEIVTVAIRRVDINQPQQDPFSYLIQQQTCDFLPNTAGARNAEEACRIARLGAEIAQRKWVKLEVTPDPTHLLPDPVETLKAAEILVKDGFDVLPYMPADPVLAKKLEDIGCVTVMPLAAPIGTNLGLEAKLFIKIIIENASIPVVVDAGIGAPSQAMECMEMGASAVLVNTAIATAKNPTLMAQSFKQAVEAGRLAYLSGLSQKQLTAAASSPLTDFLN